MSRVRVLIVDDAVVIRRIVTDVLSADPDIEVVGTAANGRIALQKIAQVNPDLVTMDVEMPDLDGVSTVRELRKTWRKLPVIMFSTLTARGASATLDALAAGANDYVTKPANVGSVTTAMDRIRDELIPKIKSLCAKSAPIGMPAKMAPITAKPFQPIVCAPRGTKPIEIVVVAVSTGGPNQLAELIPMLPGNLDVPVVIVQHMPPVFTKLLAERLDGQSAVRVVEATAGQTLERGVVYIAPGDYHVALQSTQNGMAIVTNQDPPENSCRPAADVLFRSAAALRGAGTLGVVLTGMGADGCRGARAIRESGGSVIVQDQASSVVWGMPGAVVAAGLAEGQYAGKDLAGQIVERVARSRAAKVA